MKISIRTEEHTIKIPLPNGIFLNRLSVKYVARMISKYSNTNLKLTSKQLSKLASALRHSKKTLCGLPLVHVKSSDGTEVLIYL